MKEWNGVPKLMFVYCYRRETYDTDVYINIFVFLFCCKIWFLHKFVTTHAPHIGSTQNSVKHKLRNEKICKHGQEAVSQKSAPRNAMASLSGFFLVTHVLDSHATGLVGNIKLQRTICWYRFLTYAFFVAL